MKVAAVIEFEVKAGGGFNQALNAILQMSRLAAGQFEFVVFTSVAENLDYLERLGISAKLCRPGWKDKFVAYCALNEIGRRVQGKLALVGNLEEALLKDGVDLVYFVTPSSRSLALQKLGYITTVWDLCHRDMPEFPESYRFNQFHARERLYQNCLTPAVMVLADSGILADRIAARYGVDRERIIAMPFAPAPFVVSEHALGKAEVLKKYSLEEGYFFYPAQFWAHKNHVRILEAAAILKEQGAKPNIVFVGGDQGCRGYVEDEVRRLGLSGQVHLLGFVPPEDMKALYEACGVVVMPTYFGPTNLPPLEAWSSRKPLIYSSHLADQVGDGALLVDPDDAHSLARAMQDVADPEISMEMVRRGCDRLRVIAEQRNVAEQELVGNLRRFAMRRRCWR